MGRRDKRRRKKKQLEKQSAAAIQAKTPKNGASEEIRKQKEREEQLKQIRLLKSLS